MAWDKIPPHLTHRAHSSRKPPPGEPTRPTEPRTNKSKYKAVRCEVGGLKFDSKAEARYFMDLRIRQKIGEVLWFIRQPSFDLPGGIKYRADFLEVREDGTVAVVDVKGFETPEFRLKHRLLKEAYPFELEVVKG